MLDQYARTAEEYLKECFEFGYSDECHGDTEDHTALASLSVAGEIFGDIAFFAHCNNTAICHVPSCEDYGRTHDCT